MKFRCNCILNTNTMPALVLCCAEHNEGIKDWSSDYQSPYRVVIHWRGDTAAFALHKAEYDAYGFPITLSAEAITQIFPTTAELAQEARRMGLGMDAVSDIFYDRYLEYKEFYPEKAL
ncbi:MAG: hypothetical protein AB1489_00395 [Acidobacteriota bacterium]